MPNTISAEPSTVERLLEAARRAAEGATVDREDDRVRLVHANDTLLVWQRTGLWWWELRTPYFTHSASGDPWPQVWRMMFLMANVSQKERECLVMKAAEVLDQERSRPGSSTDRIRVQRLSRVFEAAGVKSSRNRRSHPPR